jgi:hypothetical protein
MTFMELTNISSFKMVSRDTILFAKVQEHLGVVDPEMLPHYRSFAAIIQSTLIVPIQVDGKSKWNGIALLPRAMLSLIPLAFPLYPSVPSDQQN